MLEKLRKQLAELLKRAQDLSAKTVDAQGVVRKFSAEEDKEYSEIESQIEATRAAIEREEALEATRSKVKDLDKVTAGGPKITVVRNEDEDDNGQYRGFKSFGEQLMAIQRSTAPGGRVDERLHKIRAASGLNEDYSDADGGFLVQSDFMVDMMRESFDTGQLARRCRRIPISSASNSVEIVQLDETSRADGSRFGGVRAFWAAEAGTVNASQPKFRTMKLVADKMMAFCYASSEVLSDAPALNALIRQAFVEEFAFILDAAIIEGDGAGKPLGLLNSTAMQTVPKENAQTADTVQFANVSKMRNNYVTKKCRSSGVWLINQEVLTELEKMYVPLGSSNGLPVYMPAGQRGLENDTLYGREIIEVEACSKLGDLGDIMFVDLQEYAIVEKAAIDGQTSIHVRFLNDETCFRFTARVSGGPLWKTPLTPYKATTGRKISPFAVLEAR